MARMHARKRGKSGSSKPYVTDSPEWVDIEQDAVVDIIVSLAKDGRTSSEIGVILRDQYGIPNSKLVTGESVSDIMKAEKVYPNLPEDLLDLMNRAINLHEHLKQNPKDLSNKRGLHLVEAKIRRLVKYYKREGSLPEDWKYSIDKAEMLIR